MGQTNNYSIIYCGRELKRFGQRKLQKIDDSWKEERLRKYRVPGR